MNLFHRIMRLIYLKHQNNFVALDFDFESGVAFLDYTKIS